jgi:hypothetical protein
MLSKPFYVTVFIRQRWPGGDPVWRLDSLIADRPSGDD